MPYIETVAKSAVPKVKGTSRPPDYKGFRRFAQFQADFHDTGPHVVVWSHVANKMLKLAPGEKLWMVMLFMAYYHDGSMWFAFRRMQANGYGLMPPLDLPISYQRRNLFGGRIQRHIQDLYDKGPLAKYFANIKTWDELVAKVRGFYGNGRWASYTTAEMIAEMGLGPKPTDCGIAGSTGPKEGLQCLGYEGTEADAQKLLNRLSKDGLDTTPELLESMLCNWSRMCKGDFYAGFDLDRQQSRLLMVENLKKVKFDEPWKARLKVLPKKGLGEVNGWPGVDKKRIKHYKETGVVLAPWENRT